MVDTRSQSLSHDAERLSGLEPCLGSEYPKHTSQDSTWGLKEGKGVLARSSDYLARPTLGSSQVGGHCWHSEGDQGSDEVEEKVGGWGNSLGPEAGLGEDDRRLGSLVFVADGHMPGKPGWQSPC